MRLHLKKTGKDGSIYEKSPEELSFGGFCQDKIQTVSPANPSQQSQPLAPRQGPPNPGPASALSGPRWSAKVKCVSNEQPPENIGLKQKRELHRETAKVELKSFAWETHAEAPGVM
ncbi:unnamed protein product [Boreogadus saida]